MPGASKIKGVSQQRDFPASTIAPVAIQGWSPHDRALFQLDPANGEPPHSIGVGGKRPACRYEETCWCTASQLELLPPTAALYCR